LTLCGKMYTALKRKESEMTKEIEILDALPGCGKTTAILELISKNQEKSWLYLSPMKKEINERIPKAADELGLRLFIAQDKGKATEYKTMNLQVLEAMKEGKSIACTHNLMLRFTQEHLNLIEKFNYIVVCDEELDLIKGYNELKKGDVDFLLENKHISIADSDGKVSFLTEMSVDSRYGDVKLFADMGCLYAAKTRHDFLVIQVSPRIVEAASRFILLTYNYTGSIMDTFMTMHGFISKEINVPMLKTSKQRVKEIQSLISFIETPSVKKWQKRKSCLSATWWRNVSEDDLTDLSKAVKSIIVNQKAKSNEIMITFPKAHLSGYEGDYKTKKLLKVDSLDMSEAYVQYNARATNDFAHKNLAIHLTNLYPMQPVLVYMQDMGYLCDREAYALNTFIQWLFRGCIRSDQHMKVAIFSERMSVLFKDWLSKVDL
jgi:hypothetical protein